MVDNYNTYRVNKQTQPSMYQRLHARIENWSHFKPEISCTLPQFQNSPIAHMHTNLKRQHCSISAPKCHNKSCNGDERRKVGSGRLQEILSNM